MNDVTNREPGKRQSLRLWLHDVLEAGHSGNRISLCVDSFLFALIIVNVVAFALGTIERVHTRYGEPGWSCLNLISVVIFTVEYLARLWVCVEFLAAAPSAGLEGTAEVRRPTA